MFRHIGTLVISEYFLYVTGYLLTFISAEITVQPLNRSAMFLKEKDIILTNENWRIAIDLDVTPYREVISKVREDLLVVEKQKREFTLISELAQIKALLENLDWKISNFQQILPRPDPRRGLVNLGGSVLKSLFGVATVADAHKLHESLNVLQASYLDVAHSLSEQLTYIKKLDFSMDLNADDITNFSSIVKDVVMQSQERF